MSLTFDFSDLERKLKNVDAYSKGFIAGAKEGVPIMLAKIGAYVTELMGLFLDKMASGNPGALHHVYEWYQTGSAGSRLFDYDFAVGGNTLTITGQTQSSSSIPQGSRVPFYNKADVMESGQSVTINPVNVSRLKFDAGSGTIFHPGPVFVAHPGGPGVVGQWKRHSDLFINTYVTQSVLSASGMLQPLETAEEYLASFAAGANGGGFGAGFRAGMKYITNVRVGGIQI